MKQMLLDILNTTNPKSVLKKIKNNTPLLEWIQNQSTNTSNPLGQQIYDILYGAKTCAYGNSPKFKSIVEGYGGCARTGKCKCATEAVSRAIKTKWGETDNIKKQHMKEKSQKTLLERYGVENFGQTVLAKSLRKEFYDNPDNVTKAVEKNKSTKKALYGNENYNNIEKIKDTYKQRYDAKYWATKYDNEHIEILHDVSEFSKLYKTSSPYHMSLKLGVHIQTVYKYLNKYGLKNPFKSIEEQQLVDFVKSLGIENVVCNSRSVLKSGKELDIYLPDFNTAIEYNGLYWHHEDVAHITKDYHHNKFLECETQGVRLITVFSNFWKQKPEIVKSIIKNKLKLEKSSVYARQCTIKKMRSIETKNFLNKTHIQGYTPASVVYGLFHKDELVSVMTFGRSRTGIGKKTSGYELIRFASSTRVVGGASKLLKTFLNDTKDCESIFSYSDNEWSDGNLYKILGFTLDTDTKPSYWYVLPREEKMYHRFNFSKQKLIKKGHDSTLTEREITKQMGLLKVWDCGKKKWVMHL
jgi:hypothetical protein